MQILPVQTTKGRETLCDPVQKKTHIVNVKKNVLGTKADLTFRLLTQAIAGNIDVKLVINLPSPIENPMHTWKKIALNIKKLDNCLRPKNTRKNNSSKPMVV